MAPKYGAPVVLATLKLRDDYKGAYRVQLVGGMQTFGGHESRASPTRDFVRLKQKFERENTRETGLVKR